MISFKVSKFEARKIIGLAKRAVAMAAKFGVDYPMLTADMDITACHCNGCPLDLDRLEQADDSNFAHDAFGIRRHINRNTGKLEDCFMPRCAMPESITA